MFLHGWCGMKADEGTRAVTGLFLIPWLLGVLCSKHSEEWESYWWISSRTELGPSAPIGAQVCSSGETLRPCAFTALWSCVSSQEPRCGASRVSRSAGSTGSERSAGSMGQQSQPIRGSAVLRSFLLPCFPCTTRGLGPAGGHGTPCRSWACVAGGVLIPGPTPHRLFLSSLGVPLLEVQQVPRVP